MRLRYSNELVNTKIYRLIMDFEAEDTAFLLGKIDQTEAIRRRSSYVLGGIAAVAVVLMLLFVGILLRDINRSNRYRRALERANRDNEALLAAREKLMLAITHDIKAPLGSTFAPAVFASSSNSSRERSAERHPISFRMESHLDPFRCQAMENRSSY